MKSKKQMREGSSSLTVFKTETKNWFHRVVNVDFAKHM